MTSLLARFLASFFRFTENQTTLRVELTAGLTTFAAMCYVIFMQPAVLSGQLTGVDTGMPFGALVTTTCLCSALGCFLMGVIANYPLGVAPGMGVNFFFVLTLIPAVALILDEPVGSAVVWQSALGVVFLAGVLFMVATLANLRQLILTAMSVNVRLGIAAGIGIFITLIGLKNAGLTEVRDGSLEMTAHLATANIAVFFVGLLVAVALAYRKIPGAILWGIAAATLTAFGCGKVEFVEINALVSLPESPLPIMGQLSFSRVFANLLPLLPLILLLTMMDIFDTIGTLLGVATRAKMVDAQGEIPRMKAVFLSDALATMSGAFFGHSTVTSYVESSAGVESGGRTGLVAIVVGVCFLLALFVQPLISIVAAYPPITSSALVLVGLMMVACVREIAWDDLSEALPSFLIFVGIPLFYSIADGIMWGLILYPLVKLLCQQGKTVSIASYALSAILLAYMVWK